MMRSHTATPVVSLWWWQVPESVFKSQMLSIFKKRYIYLREGTFYYCSATTILLFYWAKLNVDFVKSWLIWLQNLRLKQALFLTWASAVTHSGLPQGWLLMSLLPRLSAGLACSVKPIFHKVVEQQSWEITLAPTADEETETRSCEATCLRSCSRSGLKFRWNSSLLRYKALHFPSHSGIAFLWIPAVYYII